MLPRRLARLEWRALGSGARVALAEHLRSRLLGLALVRNLPPGHGLFIPRCRSVHTFGMRFALDVIFLDRRGRVVRVVRRVPRARIVRCGRAYAVIECRAGDAALFTGAARSAA